MERTAVFLDIDGTLCNYNGEVPPSAGDAVRAARKAGHVVVLCTGRFRAGIYPELWEFGVDGLIDGNGSYVELNEKVLLHQLIPEIEAHAIVDWLHERGLDFFLESNGGLFSSEHFETAGEPVVIRQYSAGKGEENAAAMQVLVEHAGISAEHTVALGDAKDDIPMFEFARVGVAMGNAGEETQVAADFVTDDVDEHGLAHAFTRLGLITK